MRLKKLKLYSDYKKLKKGTIFNFDENSQVLTLAGVNGSGKTQLLEVITKILSNTMDSKPFLEADYHLEFELANKDYYIIFEKNEDKKYYSIFSKDDYKDYYEDYKEDYYEDYYKDYYKDYEEGYYSFKKTEYYADFFKSRLNIITYSSAKNSVLSDYYYYKQLNYIKEYRNRYENNDILLNEFKGSNKHINKRISKIIIFLLFIFEKDKTYKVLGEYIHNISVIKAFNLKVLNPLYIDYDNGNEYILPLGYCDKFIEKYFSQNDDKEDLFRANYTLNRKGYINTLKRRNKILDFEDSSFNLWIKNLEFLEMLNLLDCIDNDTINIRDNKNTSKLVEGNYTTKYFSLDNILLDNKILLDQFSDGEIQLLETLGTIILYENNEELKENLYIYDEPGTHLNTLWKSDYNYLLKKSLDSKVNDSKSQVLFSTHNQEMLADIKKDSITLLKNGKPQVIKRETFGSSINIINQEIFDKRDSVSKSVLNEIENYYKKIEKIDTIEKLKKIDTEIELFLGKSAEKIILQKELERKYIKLKNEDF